MKRYFIQALCALMLSASLAACNSRSAAVDELVDELNSPAFRAMEARTGLFDDSKAEIDGDQLVITFLCRPFINLSQITPDQLPVLNESALAEFRGNLVNEKFRDGIEALAKDKMTILLVWQDSNGGTINIPIDPQVVLAEK